MKEAILQRLFELEGAMFGALYVGGKRICYTLEKGWRDNQRSISCIPAGAYRIAPRQSPTFGATYEVLDVPDRSHILFHFGNTNDDTRGCILPGLRIGELNGKPAVLLSRAAFQHVMGAFKAAGVTDLIVRDKGR